MRKLFFAVACVSVGFLFAQSPIAPGEKQLNAGVGLSSWGVPVYVGVDFGVAQEVSLGGVFSYRNYSEFNSNLSLMVIGFNGNYHFDNILDLPSDWNVYGGLTLGYYVWGTGNNNAGNQRSGMNLEAQIGTRYFFSESFGVNLELGGGAVTGGKFGITKKF